MRPESLASAGQLLIILPAVIFGGVRILTLLIIGLVVLGIGLL